MISRAELQAVLEAHGFRYDGPDGPKWLGLVMAFLKRKKPYLHKWPKTHWISFSDDLDDRTEFFAFPGRDLQEACGILGPREQLPLLLLKPPAMTGHGSLIQQHNVAGKFLTFSLIESIDRGRQAISSCFFTFRIIV